MYVRDIKFEMTFDGQEVKAVLKPLTFNDALSIQSIEEGGDGDDTKAAIALAREFAPKLIGYVTSFEGVEDSKGDEVTIEEVCRTAYFAPVVIAMTNKLVTASSPPREPAVPSAS